MTSQLKDSFQYEGEQYDLFDVSDNKILTCKKCVGESFNEAYITCCYRGMVSSYEVVNEFLTLRSVTNLSNFENTSRLLSSLTEDNKLTRDL